MHVKGSHGCGSAITPIRLAVFFSLVAAASLPTASRAQAYPHKPVRMIVGFPVGGTADFVARIVNRKLGERFQYQIIVDNRPGSASTIGSEITAKAAPDGYTLAMISGSHAINAGFRRKLPYDPLRDFAAVSLVAAAPNVLIVTPSLPMKTMRELVDLA